MVEHRADNTEIGFESRIPTMRHIDQATLSKAMVAHEAIHDPTHPKRVTIGPQVLPIHTKRNGCRYVMLGPHTVMAVDPKNGTKYAKRAQAGEKLSWVIPGLPDMEWVLLESTKHEQTK